MWAWALTYDSGPITSFDFTPQNIVTPEVEPGFVGLVDKPIALLGVNVGDTSWN